MCQTSCLAHNKTPSMAGSWVTKLAVTALNILLGMLFVAANTDFCANVFETQVGK